MMNDDLRVLERIEQGIEDLEMQLQVTNRLLAHSLLLQQLTAAVQMGALDSEQALRRLDELVDGLDTLLRRTNMIDQERSS